jgi:hypothetical protein
MNGSMGRDARPHTSVVFHLPALGHDEIDAFCAVHRAAPAQADDEVGPEIPRDGDSRVDMLRRRVLSDLVENRAQ